MTRQQDGTSSPHGKHARKKLSKNPIIVWIWEYPLIWLALIVVGLGAKLVLPHFYIGGWEKKFAMGVIDIGRQDPPGEAVPVNSLSEIPAYFSPGLNINPESLQFRGPIITHMWRCQPLKQIAACLRLIWKGEALTVAITNTWGKMKKHKTPFLKQGWGGSFVFRDGNASVLAGPFAPDELTEIWPYARDYTPTPTPIPSPPPKK